MTPIKGTKLEYFDKDYPAYIKSSYKSSLESQGTWRQKNTSTVFAPEGKEGESVTYGFNFAWGEDYESVRDALYQNGVFDI